MEELIVNGNNFHDGIVQHLSLNFEVNETLLLLKQWDAMDDGKYTLTKLIFKHVVWQDFSDFNQFNIIWGIEVSQSFEEFKNVKKEYLIRMENYFPSGVFTNIEADKSLKYYYLNSSTGMEGFIICADLFVEFQTLVENNKNAKDI